MRDRNLYPLSIGLKSETEILGHDSHPHADAPQSYTSWALLDVRR